MSGIHKQDFKDSFLSKKKNCIQKYSVLTQTNSSLQLFKEPTDTFEMDKGILSINTEEAKLTPYVLWVVAQDQVSFSKATLKVNVSVNDPAKEPMITPLIEVYDKAQFDKFKYIWDLKVLRQEEDPHEGNNS